MARNVYDVAAALGIMTGVDQADPATAKSDGRFQTEYTTGHGEERRAVSDRIHDRPVRRRTERIADQPALYPLLFPASLEPRCPAILLGGIAACSIAAAWQPDAWNGGAGRVFRPRPRAGDGDVSLPVAGKISAPDHPAVHGRAGGVVDLVRGAVVSRRRIPHRLRVGRRDVSWRFSLFNGGQWASIKTGIVHLTRHLPRLYALRGQAEIQIRTNGSELGA